MKILITEEQLRKITESHYEIPDYFDMLDGPHKEYASKLIERARKKTKIIYETFKTGIINAYGVKLRYTLPDDFMASGDGTIIPQPYLITIKGLPKFNKILEDGTEIPYPVGEFRLLDLIDKIEKRFLNFKVHLKVDLITPHQ